VCAAQVTGATEVHAARHRAVAGAAALDSSAESEGQGEQRDPSRCGASDCPMPGSVHLGGSGYLCSAHAWAGGKQWGAISQALHDNTWLRDFITELMRDSRLAGEQAWRQHSAGYFHAYPDMQPAKGETREGYLLRMHLELMHRVGARKERPEVCIPSYQPPRQAPDSTAAGERAREIVQ
jgi:hypothetical protein